MTLFNYELLRDNAPEIYEGLPEKPYTAHFGRKRKQIRYIASDHGTPGVVNPTIGQITAAFEEFQPEFVIIEAPVAMNSSNKMRNTPDVFLWNESAFTSYQAQERNIPFMGGDAPSDKVVSGLLERGYGIDDAMGLMLLRDMPDMRMSETQLAEYAEKFFASNEAFGEIPSPQRVNWQSFQSWFSSKKSENTLEAHQIGRDFLAPYKGERATYFQQLSHAATEIREQHLNKAIENALEKYDRVIVVYGAGHLAMSQKIYATALGEPEYLRKVSPDYDMPALCIPEITGFLRAPNIATGKKL